MGVIGAGSVAAGSVAAEEAGVAPRTPVATLARAAQLAAQGVPYALATVTWRRSPSSGKGGSRAVIHPDGTVEGWLGGACARPLVVRHALEALQDGRSRLLVLGEDDSRPGVTTVPMACTSEGAMEVFVEPVLPPPDLWVVGSSPAVSTLAALAHALDWPVHEVVATTRGEVPAGLDLAGVGPWSAVVVATQGDYDEPALEAALATTAGYIGLVASAKRAAAVREWLAGQGLDEEQVARLRAPAGLDLGATEHHEIAVSVIAELVELKARRSVLGVPVAVAEPEQAVDPVCGMSVDVATARFVSRHPHGPVYFCAAGCQRAYDADPQRFPPTGSR